MPRAYAYASVTDLHRLLTFLPATFNASTRPTPSQAHQALLDSSARLDAALGLVDYTTPVATTATAAGEVLRSWAAIGAAAEIAFALPQGKDSKHAEVYRSDFQAILGSIRGRDEGLPDVARGSRSRVRSSLTARSPEAASPMFTRDNVTDR